jgi:hypothetical protein
MIRELGDREACVHLCESLQAAQAHLVCATC